MGKIEYFGFNHTHRGHHMRPNAWIPVANVAVADLQKRLQSIVDNEPRLCRIWVRLESGLERCVFWYERPKLDDLAGLLKMDGVKVAESNAPTGSIQMALVIHEGDEQGLSAAQEAELVQRQVIYNVGNLLGCTREYFICQGKSWADVHASIAEVDSVECVSDTTGGQALDSESVAPPRPRGPRP